METATNRAAKIYDSIAKHVQFDREFPPNCDLLRYPYEVTSADISKKIDSYFRGDHNFDDPPVKRWYDECRSLLGSHSEVKLEDNIINSPIEIMKSILFMLKMEF